MSTVSNEPHGAEPSANEGAATPSIKPSAGEATAAQAPDAGFPAAVALADGSVVTAEVLHYVASPEKGAFPLWWLLVFLADLLITLAHFRGYVLAGISHLAFFEILAIVNTFLAACLYYYDLKKAADDDLLAGEHGWPMVVGVLCFINLLLLVLAAVCLYLYELSERQATVLGFQAAEVKFSGNIAYVVLLVSSFLMFTGLDYIFSKQSISSRKTREYWELLFFVDAPASIAFFILGTLYVSGRHNLELAPSISFEIVSGAIITQMIFADLLFLLVQTNLHHVALEKLRGNATKD